MSSPIDPIQKSPHPLWGSLLDDYLHESPPGEHFTTRATHDEIVKTLRILKTGRPSCTDLELLLSLPNRPGQLGYFLDVGLIPRCVRLIREHRKSNGILGHAYGLLCLRTLCLILEVSLLERIDTDIFMGANDLNNHEDLAGLLGIVTTKITGNNELSWPGHKHLKDLNWHSVAGPRPMGFSCLPKSGGLCWSDVEFLMRALRDDAGPIQRVCRASNILGFGTLLFLFWQHTLIMSHKPPPTQIILNLIARYRPHAVQGEDEILLYIFDWAYSLSDESLNSGIVSKDVLDMSALMETYANLMTNSSTSQKFLSVGDAIGFVESLAGGPVDMVPRRVAPLILSILDRCWMELVALRHSKDVEPIMRLCGSALSIAFPLRSIGHDLLPGLLPPLANEADIDYINLMGRLVVLGLRSALRSTDPMPLKALLFKSNFFLDFLEGASAPVAETFKHVHRDWLKVARWIDFQFDVLGHGDSKAQEVWVCSNGWHELGAAFGCIEQIVRAECASPRCFGELATVSCDQCSTTAYCSARCQMMDWSIGGEQSHRSQCQPIPLDLVACLKSTDV